MSGPTFTCCDIDRFAKSVKETTMLQQWFEVQRHLGQVYVARQSGGMPPLQDQQALVRIVSAGVCGTDIRVTHGNKQIYSNPHHYIVPGHEGIGQIIDIKHDEESGLKRGDFVVVLPHVHKDTVCPTSEITPRCIGNNHTLHRGWDLDGCFADFITVPITSLRSIDPCYLHLAKKKAPELAETIFAFVEPMLCVLSAYTLIEEQSKILLKRDLRPGRALVIGNGPIGVLHGLNLLKRGYTVWLQDTIQKRSELARWCLGDQSFIFHEETDERDFDIVIVAASTADAIKKAELMVQQEGIVYLFAGLNTGDRTAMGSENLFYYEQLHRATKGLMTNTAGKTILYIGHSGYFEHLITDAIAAVAESADNLSRSVTGVIPSWSSPSIRSRLPGGLDWETPDGSPAIVSVLGNTDLCMRHCKILICPH